MPLRKNNMSRKKRSFKSKRRSKRRNKSPSGDKLTRSFRYPGLIFSQAGITQGTGPFYDTTKILHTLRDAGASDASVFCKYYQLYRIRKVYLKIRCLTDKLVQTNSASTASPPGVYPMLDRCAVHCIPWRDGVNIPTMTAQILQKLRQQKGAKSFNLPFSQLKKGFTIKYTPNTLDVGFESQGVLTYNNYRPQYGQWLSNNDMGTVHYGYIIIIEQYSQSALQMALSQTITVDFKYKINDPLISIENTTTSNSIVNVVNSNDNIVYDHDNVGMPRAVPVSNDPLDNDADVYNDRDEGLPLPTAG